MPALSRRQRLILAAAEGEDAEPVAAPRRDVPDRERGAGRDVALAPLGGAEAHRGRDVEHEPGDEHALGEVDAHVRHVRPRRDVPLDQPHVVAGHVRPHLRELGSLAVAGRAELAREQPVDAAADVELQRTQKRGGEVAPAGERAHATAGGRALLTSGAGTAASTRSRISSALTFSASAW